MYIYVTMLWFSAPDVRFGKVLRLSIFLYSVGIKPYQMLLLRCGKLPLFYVKVGGVAVCFFEFLGVNESHVISSRLFFEVS
jgi:hypothetical protein